MIIGVVLFLQSFFTLSFEDFANCLLGVLIVRGVGARAHNSIKFEIRVSTFLWFASISEA